MDNSSGKGMGGWVEAAGCTALPERMREEEEGLVWLVLLGNTVVVGYRSTTTVRERESREEGRAPIRRWRRKTTAGTKTT